MLVKIYVTELSPPNIDFFGTSHVQSTSNLEVMYKQQL